MSATGNFLAHPPEHSRGKLIDALAGDAALTPNQVTTAQITANPSLFDAIAQIANADPETLKKIYQASPYIRPDFVDMRSIFTQDGFLITMHIDDNQTKIGHAGLKTLNGEIFDGDNGRWCFKFANHKNEQGAAFVIKRNLLILDEKVCDIFRANSPVIFQKLALDCENAWAAIRHDLGHGYFPYKTSLPLFMEILSEVTNRMGERRRGYEAFLQLCHATQLHHSPAMQSHHEALINGVHRIFIRANNCASIAKQNGADPFDVHQAQIYFHKLGFWFLWHVGIADDPKMEFLRDEYDASLCLPTTPADPRTNFTARLDAAAEMVDRRLHSPSLNLGGMIGRISAKDAMRSVVDQPEVLGKITSRMVGALVQDLKL